jgi:hypothetical protein
MREQINQVLHQVHQDLTKSGYTVYAVVLKGSQNYNLHDSESDIDLTAIVIPTLRDIINHKTISTKLIYPFGEVVIHDIIHFNNILYKGNPGYIEMVHSQYQIGEDLSMFQDYKINPKALLGMALEKQKALTHRYPSREHMIDKFGYDPKQLHHIMRLRDIAIKLQDNDNYTYRVYTLWGRDTLLKLKRGNGTCSTKAQIEAIGLIQDIRSIINNNETLSTWQQIEKVDILPLIESYLIKEYKGEQL